MTRSASSRVGASRTTNDTIENGVSVPSTEIALAIDVVLDRPVERLFALPPGRLAKPAADQDASSNASSSMR